MCLWRVGEEVPFEVCLENYCGPPKYTQTRRIVKGEAREEFSSTSRTAREAEPQMEWSHDGKPEAFRKESGRAAPISVIWLLAFRRRHSGRFICFSRALNRASARRSSRAGSTEAKIANAERSVTSLSSHDNASSLSPSAVYATAKL